MFACMAKFRYCLFMSFHGSPYIWQVSHLRKKLLTWSRLLYIKTQVDYDGYNRKNWLAILFGESLQAYVWRCQWFANCIIYHSGNHANDPTIWFKNLKKNTYQFPNFFFMCSPYQYFWGLYFWRTLLGLLKEKELFVWMKAWCPLLMDFWWQVIII